MMGMSMPETCWAVSKRQVINVRSCCILLVDSVENLYFYLCIFPNTGPTIMGQLNRIPHSLGTSFRADIPPFNILITDSTQTLWGGGGSFKYLCLAPSSLDPNLITLQTAATQPNAALARSQRRVYIVEKYQITTRRNKKYIYYPWQKSSPFVTGLFLELMEQHKRKLHNRTQ